MTVLARVRSSGAVSHRSQDALADEESSKELASLPTPGVVLGSARVVAPWPASAPGHVDLSDGQGPLWRRSISGLAADDNQASVINLLKREFN